MALNFDCMADVLKRHERVNAFNLVFVFFRPSKNMRQPFSGTAERIFMKLLPNDRGENVVFNVVPEWGLGPNNFGGLKTEKSRKIVISV